MHTIHQNRYEELDALRGIAALLVLFFHFTMARQEYNFLLKLGTTGVDLFFMISGFVIFMSLQKTSKGSDFIVNRASRLYPTYWASVLFTFILVTVYTLYNSTYQLKDSIITFLGNLTMFQFYIGIPNLDGAYWTLIIEMLFYIAVFILYQLKLLKHINTIGIIACLLTVLLTHFFYCRTFVVIMNWIPLIKFLPLFFAGTVFYKIYTKGTKLLQNYTIIIFCLLCQMVLFPFAGRSRYFISWSQYELMIAIYFALFTLFVNFKLKFIVNKTTLFFGKISFALYLTHQYLSLQFIIPFFFEELGVNFWVVILFINLPVVIGIAYIITYKVEVPCSRKMKEKLRSLMA